MNPGFFVHKDAEGGVGGAIIDIEEEEPPVFNFDGGPFLTVLTGGDAEEHDEDDEALEKGQHCAFHGFMCLSIFVSVVSC